MKPIEIDDATFEQFRKLIYEAAGIEYPVTKRTLFLNRIRGRLESLGLDTPRQYLEVLRSKASPHEQQEFLDAITTNETYYFRCQRHWDFFERFMKERDQTVPAGRRIKIWSAAASIGAEAYSAAIVLHELFGTAKVRDRFEILGTDLNHAVLEEARKGIYTPLTLRGLDEKRRDRWLKPGSKVDSFEVHKDLRTNVTFRPHNLLEPMRSGPFDMIFLRNVMIYFDRQSKERVLRRAYDACQSGGALLLGESESLVQVEHPFRNGETSVLYKDGQTVAS